MELIDLALYDRPTRLVWHRRSWRCGEPSSPHTSWKEEEPRIGAPRMVMTARACRFVTEQIGRYAGNVNEIAKGLDHDRYAVNDPIVTYGSAPIDDDPLRYGTARHGTVNALGLDEVLFCQIAPWHEKKFSTQIIDVIAGLGY